MLELVLLQIIMLVFTNTLVPLSSARRAAMEAIAQVEKKRDRKGEMAGLPLWQLGAEARFLSKEASVLVRELERWMVPNKLTHRGLL